MRVAALFSGGKDSAYATLLSLESGWDVSCLVTLSPQNPSSYMFHHPNVWLTKLQAESAGIPHRLVPTSGEKERELQDLKTALSGLDIDGVVCGAVASEYQKERVDFVCDELGLKSFAPLWHKNEEALAREEAETLDAIIVSVSADGLGMEWLGRKFDAAAVDDLVRLREKTGLSVIGEGGEFETLVLDAPFFKTGLRITSSKTAWEGSSGVLQVEKAESGGF